MVPYMENEEFILDCQKNGGDQLNDYLKSNEGLVKSIMHRHFRRSLHLSEDLQQEGSLGLLESLRRYKRGFFPQFNYYKSIWIRKYMQNFLKKNKAISPLLDGYDVVSTAPSQGLIIDSIFALDFIGEQGKMSNKKAKQLFKQIICR